MRVSTMIVLATAGLALAGCATTAAQTTPGISTGSVVSPPPMVSASDADNGHTITLAVGQQLDVLLHSTYWHFGQPGTPLKLAGLPMPTPAPGHCVPGGGCGTVYAIYQGAAPGTTDVTATRTSCGEAMACTGANGVYRLTVIVR